MSFSMNGIVQNIQASNATFPPHRNWGTRMTSLMWANFYHFATIDGCAFSRPSYMCYHQPEGSTTQNLMMNTDFPTFSQYHNSKLHSRHVHQRHLQPADSI
jgi:hypothetical protein